MFVENLWEVGKKGVTTCPRDLVTTSTIPQHIL